MGNGSDLVAAVRAALQAEAETLQQVRDARILCDTQADRYGDIGTRHTNKVATQYRRAAVALAAVVELLERDAS